MANARVSKADRLLNRLATGKICSITPDGVNFVRQRFDPYHDLPVKPTGLPDDYNGVTVTRCIKRTITLSQTSGLAPATETPWDMHIVNTPDLTSSYYKPCVSNANSCEYTNTGVPDRYYGGIVMVGNNTSGTPFNFPPVEGVSGTQSLLGTLQLNENDLANNMRVVAMGFEVIDGTAELYRQGVLTCYRQNQPRETDFHLIAKASTNPGNAVVSTLEGSARIFKLPPTTTAAALLIPGSKQWLVKEGAYVSVDFHSNPPMELPKMIIPVLQQDNAPMPAKTVGSTFTYVNVVSSYVDIPVPGTSPATTFRKVLTEPTKHLPVNQHGIILSGLHPLATITINAIWYIECAPDGDDEELLTLAYPSPQLDTLALMMVSELRRDSPVAVKLYENYMGEWFVDGVKDIIKKVSPWLSNAQIVGSQIVDWADQASNNNGMLSSPQTFTRGPVTNKVSRDNKIIKAGKVPKAPGPAPPARAFRPKPIVMVNARRTNEPQSAKKFRRIRVFDPTEDNKRARDNAIKRKAARGDYDESQKLYTHDYESRAPRDRHNSRRKTPYSRR